MTVALSEMRSLLLPGLLEVTSYYSVIPAQWPEVFTVAITEPALPTISPPLALAMGAAAAVIANPETTRRDLLSWWSS